MNTFEEQEFSKQIDLQLWKKLFRFCGNYKKNLALLIGSNVLIAAGDAIFPQMTRYAIDNFIGTGDRTNLPWFIAGFIALILVQAVNVFMFIDQAGKLETSIVHDVRKIGFDHLQKLSFSYYDNTPVGWIMARMTTDAQRIGDIIAWGCVDVAWALSILVFSITFMFVTNAKLALAVIAVIPLLALISIYFQKKILRGHREVRRINSKITGTFNEGINGARTTKTLIRERKNFEEFGALSSSMRQASIRVATISAIYFPLVMSIGSIAVALVLGIGGLEVMGGVVSLGVLTVFVSYASQMFEPINQIARIISEMQSAQASAERTMSLIETELEIQDSPELIEKYGDFMNPKPENWPDIKGDIEFRNVTFKYKTGEQVLEDFSLTIGAGEKIALVGETGSGKSTIVNLICRFYEPTDGEILIDGVDYKERTQIWLQSNLGYVLQTPHLFSGTIKDNIRYGKLDATDEEVEEVARIVGAHSFITRFQKGFDADVGEGGSKLSSGEKQLISFARAIIGNPKLFVLDEATSSIDTETEQMIQSAIDKVLAGRTSFIVAHRLSTIRSCDRILVIDKGKVIESGSHRELLRKRGHYYQLYTNQFRDEAAGKLLNA